MDSKENQKKHPDFYQNVVVMRHGDRIDAFDPSWVKTAARPWDPPLIQCGQVRAFKTGRTFRYSVGYPINRVFVSPFLRCVQTASEVVSALCALYCDPNSRTSCGVPIDPTEVKVSVELGLCEAMSSEVIIIPPKDGNWGFDVTEIEAMLPVGTVDKRVKRVYKELPRWEETVSDTMDRYEQTIKDLANNYPTENLLLVTHRGGVEVALSAFSKNAEEREVGFCAYVELERPIFRKDQSLFAGDFEALPQSG